MFFYEFSHQFRNCNSLTYLYFSLALSVLTDYLSAFFIPIFLIKYMINFTIPIAIKYIPNLNNIIYALPPFIYVATLTNHVVFEPFIFWHCVSSYFIDSRWLIMYDLTKIIPQINTQSLSSVSELLAQVSVRALKRNSIVKHVGQVPMACQNCPYLQNKLNCNQCNRWNQQQ